MAEFTVARQNDVKASALPGNVTIHLYPFKTLPLLECHLHPKFAIVEAGRRMQKYRKWALTSQEHVALVETVTSQWPTITKIEDIYEAWMRPLPDGALENHMFDPLEHLGDDESDDESMGSGNSFQTGPRQSKRKYSMAMLSQGHTTLE